jgi:hypothetical protein
MILRPERWPTDSPFPPSLEPTSFDSSFSSHAPS